METTPTSSPRPAVALGGFMGAGKSTVGRALAHRLSVPFVDMDAVLRDRFGPIAEQFASKGEEVFRQRERALVRELCDGRPRVVATGGGVWEDPRNRDALRPHYRMVVLDAPVEVLRARVGDDPGRPNRRRFDALYDRRREAYGDAELTVDARQPVDRIVQEVTAWIG